MSKLTKEEIHKAIDDSNLEFARYRRTVQEFPESANEGIRTRRVKIFALKFTEKMLSDPKLNTLCIGLDEFPEDSTMDMERPELYMKNAFKAMRDQLIKEIDDEIQR